MSQFKAGDRVYINTLKKEGTVVRPIRKGWYLVSLGNLSVDCKAEHLSAIFKDSKNKNVSDFKKKKPLQNQNRNSPAMQVDFHGLTASQALESLEYAISEALIKDSEYLDVVHGIGSGILKNAIHKHLKEHQSVVRFMILEKNVGPPRVYFD